MDIVKWFKRYQRAKFTAESLWRQARDWQERISGVSSMVLDGMPHGGAKLDSFESGVVKALDLEHDAQLQTQYARKVRTEIQEKINEVEDLDAFKILTLRYLEGKSWSEISKEMNFCRSNVYKIHNDTLAKLATEMDEIGQS